MLETQVNDLEYVAQRLQTLMDLYGRDITRWPSEAQSEAYSLNDKAPATIADALQQLRKSCPDC
jgi:hypothetical protein